MTVSLQLIQRVGMWGQQLAVASPACPNHSELCLWEPCPGVCTGTVLSLLQRERLEIKETFYPQASCIFFLHTLRKQRNPKWPLNTIGSAKPPAVLAFHIVV